MWSSARYYQDVMHAAAVGRKYMGEPQASVDRACAHMQAKMDGPEAYTKNDLLREMSANRDSEGIWYKKFAEAANGDVNVFAPRK